MFSFSRGSSLFSKAVAAKPEAGLVGGRSGARNLFDYWTRRGTRGNIRKERRDKD